MLVRIEDELSMPGNTETGLRKITDLLQA